MGRADGPEAARYGSAMTQKWEYATVPLLVHATKQILDTWGEDGWELVQVVPGPNARAAGRLPEAADGRERASRSGSPSSGLTLPDGRRAGGGVRAGGARPATCVYTSGQLPIVDGELPATGKVGARGRPPRTPQRARRGLRAERARRGRRRVGDLDQVARVVKVVGFVASAPGFTGQPGVVNGASELLGEVFGDAGRARAQRGRRRGAAARTRRSRSRSSPSLR